MAALVVGVVNAAMAAALPPLTGWAFRAEGVGIMRRQAAVVVQAASVRRAPLEEIRKLRAVVGWALRAQ